MYEHLNLAHSENESLIQKLMELETTLVEQCHGLVDTLESQVESIGNSSRDVATEHFRAVEELENHYFDAVTQVYVQELYVYIEIPNVMYISWHPICLKERHQRIWKMTIYSVMNVKRS